MAATIDDVASLAGCSITTVSRAFTKPEKVKDETLRKIQAAAKSLNYSPNAIARAMVMQQNHSIAFVISEKHYPITLNPFYAAISEAVQMEAEKRGYNVYIVSNQAMAQNAMFMKKRVDGVILAGQTDQDLLHTLCAQGMPLVLINNHLDLEGIVSITADDYGGAVQAMEYLIRKSHTRIGLISGHLFPYISANRYRAYLDTMALHALPVDPRLVRDVEPHQEDALVCVNEMLQSEAPPTALFCMNDSLGVGAIKAALRLGLRVPQDLAVVGYDGSSLCTVIEPELTSISVDTQRMGKLGAKRLIRMIDGEIPPEKHIVLPTALIARGST